MNPSRCRRAVTGCSGLTGCTDFKTRDGCHVDFQASMLVVGRRGQSGVKQAAMSVAGLGSVSSTCVGSAPCPVLVTLLPRAPA